MVATRWFKVDIGPSWELVDALIRPCSLRKVLPLLLWLSVSRTITAAAAGGGRPGSHSRRAAPLFESIAGGGDVAMPGLEYASEEDDDDSEATRRAKQARRAKAGEATAAAVAELQRMRGGQQERKQYKRSTTSYGLRKLPKPPGCRKCKGNARGCRIKDHQLEDASDEQVRSSSVLLY